jgi:hypothetical protein
MIKGNRKNQRHYEQQHQHSLVISPYNQQEKEAHHEDHNLSRNDVGENCAHKKPVLTLEKRETIWAVMPDMKRSCDDAGLATGGTTKSQTTTQYFFDLSRIYFQRPAHILFHAKAQRSKAAVDFPLLLRVFA